MTLLDRLIQRFPTAKRETFRRMISDGRVEVNGKRAATLKQPVGEGDAVDILERVENRPATRISVPFKIVFEDKDVLLIDKPAGLLTSTVPRETRTTALQLVRDYLARDRNARVGLIHRLDRDASGLLIFSKNDRAYQSLKSQFFHHTVKRVYTAIVSPAPRPAEGKIESHLVEWADGTVHSTKVRGKGELAVTEYKTLEKGSKMARLRVKLETGRKHQIRVHLSEGGWPIIGDDVYGGKPDEAGLMLAATELAFDYPASGKRLEFTIETPGRMKSLLKNISNL